MAALSGRASAVVCANREALAPPTNGYVGWWNGSSAVCIGPNLVISARHVGGHVGDIFWMRGHSYRAVEVVPHPDQDIEWIRVAETLPGYHRLANNVRVGDMAILGGFGNTAGNPVDGGGYDWSGAQQETWGANVIDNVGWLMVINFTHPAAPSAVPNESTFADHDSGAGLFVRGARGELELAGLAVSVSDYGSSLYGDSAFCLNMEVVRRWLPCAADFDGSGEVTDRDLFAYMRAWAAGFPEAEFDGTQGITVQDLFSFLGAYFGGCS